MRKILLLVALGIGTVCSLKAQTQTQDLNMGLNQLQFPSANGGFNRVQSFGGTFPGKWLFKSRFDDIYLDAGENSGNRYKILFLSGGIERARMDGDGKFGIGTTNPTQKLQVDALSSTIQIQLNRTGSSAGKADFGVDNNGLHYWVGGYDGFGKEEFFIGTNGNIGIGTTTPDTKLAVNGNIHAKEVKVDLVGWPDYVFENDYELPTLQEVEHHIAKKGHLENIPSAAAVAENGIQLGEMNAKLLQKIEELTLYMIEQNKKTENLIKEVAALKQKNAELEQRMK